MKERPILLSGPMVRAILKGRKTQTRRVVKPQPEFEFHGVPFLKAHEIGEAPSPIKCPFGAPGDQLWVKETWAAWDGLDSESDEMDGDAKTLWERGISQAHISYKADPMTAASRWRPSIHMPQWASRITLEVESVRVERLQDISDYDSYREGAESMAGTITGPYCMSYKEGFRELWQSINGPCSWDANPFVWVIQFRRVKP